MVLAYIYRCLVSTLLCSSCMCYTINIKISFISSKAFIGGKMNTKYKIFCLDYPVNKITNKERDNKEKFLGKYNAKNFLFQICGITFYLKSFISHTSQISSLMYIEL